VRSIGRLSETHFRRMSKADEASPIIADGLLRQLIGEASRVTRGAGRYTPSKWLLRAVDIIEKRYMDGISIEDVARSVGVHPIYLAKVFRRYRGCSPHEYLATLRIQAAAEALRCSTASISSIGESLGFCDQSHFTHEFRKWTGKSPARFRADACAVATGETACVAGKALLTLESRREAATERGRRRQEATGSCAVGLPKGGVHSAATEKATARASG